MVKAKPTSRSSIKSKGKPVESVTRRTVLTIKGTDAWHQWIVRLAEHLRMPTSTVVDHALVQYAKAMGFEAEAPGR